MLLRPALLLLLALASCGDLPQPFLGRPGANATRLAQPPPSRLAVPPPSESLLPDSGSNAWAQAMADALLAEEVPAVRIAPRRGDWVLLLSAEMRGNTVVPTYTVQNPLGKPQGTAQGAPVPVRAWASGDPAVLKQAAAQAAPGVVALLSGIEAARRQSDPTSLQNRPARVYFTGVSGAPGDGNRSLPAQMRVKLTDLGIVVQDTAANADFKLRGDVETHPGAKGTVRVEVQWIINDPNGDERGRILQMNEVPRGTLDSFWGDVAVVVANEASGGVRDVITNATPGKAEAGKR